MTKEKKRTSVQVQEGLFYQFRQECIKYKFSFQKLADRSIFLYLTDSEFRKKIHNQTNITLD